MQVYNHKAKFDYDIGDQYEAGIVLSGSEAKAARMGDVDLTSAHAKIIDGEVFLINATIGKGEEPKRTRKLLLKKGEIIAINSKIRAKKLTLVPTKIYTHSGFVKVEIALAKTKKRHSKRESLKKRDQQREVEKELSRR